jgi:hypothetical protein
MKCWRSIARGMLLLTFAMVGTSGVSGNSSTAPMPNTSENDAVALSPSLRPEVRLRKLHLVRPDLIQYPIAFEIYC